jgi:putative glutamine amidotransferase
MKTNLKRIFPLLTLIFVVSLLWQCSSEQPEPVRIAVTKLSANYENWLLQTDSTLIITDLYPMGVKPALEILRGHHALLITGGEDVFPDWYGMIHDTARCGEFDYYRDTLEIMMITAALQLNLPVLGICRGHQILNVALGGSLVIDIPDDIGTEVTHRCPGQPLDCYHEVSIVSGSFLQEITGKMSGTVNTNHHQAVNRLADGLMISAFSNEGLPEAVEWENAEGRPFLLGVQWHPERMSDYPELSTPIAERFIQAARKYQQYIRDIHKSME